MSHLAYFQYPERVYTCPAGVTAMDFSLTHPNLLAVSNNFRNYSVESEETGDHTFSCTYRVILLEK